jgi:hypothetical protein
VSRRGARRVFASRSRSGKLFTRFSLHGRKLTTNETQ